jgi:mannan endo-1,6-alpha-mannosidase
MMNYYVGNQYGQTPGILPGPYYWWEAGAMWGAMVNYWHYTNDSKWNDLTMQALQWQVGPHNDFMPPNASASLGNDDQAFWGMAALQAAEYRFPDPVYPAPSWLSLAQAVFNEQTGRWDTQHCNGGIRWQIYEITGWNLKNSISNGCLFNIASRLARYTSDDMYAQWAEKVWDWMWRIGLIDTNYNVYDNTEADRLNCTTIDHAQWSYNAGTMLMGASTMWNYVRLYSIHSLSPFPSSPLTTPQTQSDLWKNRTSNLLSTIVFDYFPDSVMKDICEQNNACNVDQRSFKAYLSRWLAATTQMAPFTYPIIAPLLLSSAKAAAAQCTGAPTGNVCGLKWYNNGTWDGTAGVGQQMAALEVVLGTMVHKAAAAVTNTTGGTSPSNPNAGYNSSSIPPGQTVSPPTKADKVGAWFLTAIFSVGALYMWWFMNTSSHEWGSRPTVGGKPGRKGRTISTLDMGTSSGSTVMAGATGTGAANGGTKYAGAASKEYVAGAGLPLHERTYSNGAPRTKRQSNVLTKPDRSSTFSSSGVFPSDRNGHAHSRSASFVSDKGARNSMRSLPPIHEKEKEERRRRRSSGQQGHKERGQSFGEEKERRGSRFKEEEMPSRLD